jgi:hypothetical protein
MVMVERRMQCMPDSPCLFLLTFLGGAIGGSWRFALYHSALCAMGVLMLLL